MDFKNQSVISASQFDRPGLDRLFALAARLPAIAERRVKCQILNGFILLNVFFEASTRTRMSFSSAFQRLGGNVDNIQGVSFSSMMKGETFSDTIRVIQEYGDVLVIRTAKQGQVAEAARLSAKPVINAGDGQGEHPTQGLLDLYSIQAEKGRVDGLNIAIVGDLKYSRTAHSLTRLITEYESIQLRLVSPTSLKLPEEQRHWLKRGMVPFAETEEFEAGISGADVVYMIRVQKERFDDPAEYERTHNAFILTRQKVERVCKKDVIILHPLPRTVEIHPDVDALEKNAAYFRQSKRGLELRMALFLLTLGKEHKLV